MRRPQSALVLVGVLALVGGGTALAGKGTSGSSTTSTTTTTTTTAPTHPFRGGGPHGPSDELEAAATYLGTTTANLETQLQAGKTLAQIASATGGKSTAGLIAALVAAEKTEIAAAVKANRLTQAQADAITANLQQRFTDLVNGVHPNRGPGGPHGFGDHGPLDAAATYLGLSQSALMTQLQAGKTLAQIANATSGKSAAGLIAALVADAKQHFGSSLPADLEQRITDLVNGVRPAFGPGDGRHDHGPFGPPPSGGSSA